RASIRSLEICANGFPECTDFFTQENSTNLRNFKLVMRKIEEFIRKLQDIHNPRLFFDPNAIKNIKNEFYGLITEFDGYMELLKFLITIEIRQQNIDLINRDIEETREYLLSIMESVNKEQINKIEEIKLSDINISTISASSQSSDIGKNVVENGYESTSNDIALSNLVNISTISASSQSSDIGINVTENGYENTSNDSHNNIALSNSSSQSSDISNTLLNLEINITSTIS
ncbi:11482_t:CDS:2, partial [Racocetra fulgida]